jgi:hypothetical protein
MPSPRSPDPATTAFLVERYVTPAAAAGLTASVARVALLCTDPSGPGPGVQYLQSTYLPSEDTCFCLFRGPSSDAVREVNSRAAFAVDRITDAVQLLPGNSASR